MTAAPARSLCLTAPPRSRCLAMGGAEQPRVPAGSPGGGEWMTGGGAFRSVEDFHAAGRAAEAAAPSSVADHAMRTASLPADWPARKVARAIGTPWETGAAAVPGLKRAADLLGAAVAVRENYAAFPAHTAAAMAGPHGAAVRGAAAWADGAAPEADAAFGRHAAAVAKGLPDVAPVDADPAAVRDALIVHPEDLPPGVRAGVAALAPKMNRLATHGLGDVVLAAGGDSPASRAARSIHVNGSLGMGTRLRDEEPAFHGKHLERLWDKSSEPVVSGQYKRLTDTTYIKRGGYGTKLVHRDKVPGLSPAAPASAAMGREPAALAFDRSPPGGGAVAEAELGPGEVVSPAEGEPADELGIPVLYAEKPLLEVGQVADTDEGRITITAEAMELADRCTREWIADGGRPFVPRGHRSFDKAENLGWLTGTRFDGRRLIGRHKLIGADAHLAAARNDSSVMLRWNFAHGGKVYPLIIEHNAILPDPKMRGLGKFVALGREGAGDAAVQVPVWSFRASFDRAPLTGGRWVTINGNAVYIRDSAGVVPARLRGEAGDLKRFTRGRLEKAILDHHRDKSGESGEYTAGMERELAEHANSAETAFTFHKKLPTEIKSAIADNPALRKVFTVSGDTRQAHGADAYGSLGHDRYVAIAEAKAGSPLRQAKEFARQSGDPEAAFLAHVHDNLPRGGTRALDPVKAGGLRVGDEFTIGGQAHRVAEDESGYRVLRSHEYAGERARETPLDAVTTVPVDKGSFRRGRRPAVLTAAGDGIPFARSLCLSSHTPPAPWPPPEWEGEEEIPLPPSEFVAMAFGRPDQPRDERGRWIGSGGGDTPASRGASIRSAVDRKKGAPVTVTTRAAKHTLTVERRGNGEDRLSVIMHPPEAKPYQVTHATETDNGTVRHYPTFHATEEEARAAMVAKAESVERAARADGSHRRTAVGVPAKATVAPAGNATVDTSRQFGLFAKDSKGRPAEIGERPGQASLFNAGKYDKGPPAKNAAAPKDEPGQIVMPAAPAYDPFADHSEPPAARSRRAAGRAAARMGEHRAARRLGYAFGRPEPKARPLCLQPH